MRARPPHARRRRAHGARPRPCGRRAGDANSHRRARAPRSAVRAGCSRLRTPSRRDAPLPARAAMQRANDALWLVGLGEERFRPVTTMSTGERGGEARGRDRPRPGARPARRAHRRPRSPCSASVMLDLIRRIGTEFGMHIVVSSHHLEEVDLRRSGDRRGRHRRTGRPPRRLRRGPEGLVVEVDDRAEELVELLVTKGFTATAEGAILLVSGEDGMHDAVRDAVAELGVSAPSRAARAHARGASISESESTREHGARGPALRSRLPRVRSVLAGGRPLRS